ncbi:permease (plasmid) [Azospirillum argentinense]|uniref:Permease n=1 Tax=Azospirillum argentinense TaxID=2970906 RepID=A0A060DNF1_9PROT|nr:SLC13 family permease [Azospirillum argentinense]AIB14280.1 permease [Azospirillum argentinense]EZQ05484.1 permease [Azospirillum argentinense]PNQ95821.1 SLC13 family permease [Azospirillum argentinense]
MTLDQGLAFGIIGAVIALLIWDKLRYDLVAMLALLAAVAVGIVKPKDAFSGFSDDIVIIVGSALVVSAAVGRSGIVEEVMRPLSARMKTVPAQIIVLTGAVTLLSAVVKNIGALAIFMPIAMQVARRNGTKVSSLLMPMAFGSLLGGLMTLVGTSPNIIVSRLRNEMVGEPFGMFDFTPVGLTVAVAGVAFLTVGYRLLPTGRQAASGNAGGFSIDDYTAEALLPEKSPFVGKTVADLEAYGEGDVTVAAIIRGRHRRHIPSGHWVLLAGDVLVLEADTQALGDLVKHAGLELMHEKELEGVESDEDLAVLEAVVEPRSPLIGSNVEDVELRERYGANLLALSRRGRPIRQRLRRVRFQPGDLVVLQARAAGLSDTLNELGCLPLAERNLSIGRRRKRRIALAVMAVTIGLVATSLVPVTLAFFGAAVAMTALRVVTLKEAYESIEWPILVLLGALIPVSEALRTTGGTELIAGWLSIAAQGLPPIGALAMMLVAAMAVTPFLNNAATVLVMAPIAASLANHLGLRPDAFLMAVAVGAGCDFLTPIGHQCNTLVMGPGGYRFSDYARLGLPLSLIVIVLGTTAIALFWPLMPH